MFSQKFKISNLNVSNKDRSLIIAEIGINHEGNFQRCLKMVDQANQSGADLIKIQVLNPKKNYLKGVKSLKIYNKSILTREEVYNVYQFSKKKKIKLFSTFDKENFDFIKKLKPICFKISSSLFYDYFFIKKIQNENKPLLISTGVVDLKDIEILLKLISKNKNKKIALMHCRSLYPTPLDKSNLSRVQFLKDNNNIITGYSDHTKGLKAPIASIHYGAKIIEKHFSFDNTRANYDHKISLEPKKFLEMVNEIRENEKMIGDYRFKLNDNLSDFKKIKKITRQFIINKDIKKNYRLSEKDVDLLRIPNKKYFFNFENIIEKILRKKINKNLKKGHQLLIKDFY